MKTFLLRSIFFLIFKFYIINLTYSVKGLLHICSEMTELSKVGKQKKKKKKEEENISQPFLQSICGLVLIVHAAN